MINAKMEIYIGGGLWRFCSPYIYIGRQRFRMREAFGPLVAAAFYGEPALTLCLIYEPYFYGQGRFFFENILVLLL